MDVLEIYADTAEIELLREAVKDPRIKGITTNPSLMKKANISSYSDFVRQVCALTPLPKSFEIFSKDETMIEEAIKLSSFGENIFVKIPIHNHLGEKNYHLIEKMIGKVRLNITAVFTLDDVSWLSQRLEAGDIISVFAGRIADAGLDATAYMQQCALTKNNLASPARLLWASCREYANIAEARKALCDISTVPYAFIQKFDSYKSKTLTQLCNETVSMFYNDCKDMTGVL